MKTKLSATARKMLPVGGQKTVKGKSKALRVQKELNAFINKTKYKGTVRMYKVKRGVYAFRLYTPAGTYDTFTRKITR